MAIVYLDGQRFRRVVIAGADWVKRTREDINRINVFPVADGDTGTNMALTLSATASALRDSRETALGSVAVFGAITGALCTVKPAPEIPR